MGYETGLPERLKRVCDEIGDSRWGINLDMGHVEAFNAIPTEKVIKEFGQRIVEVHVNSLTQYFGGIIEHQPLERNNILDYPRIFKVLKKENYTGPLVIEMLGKDIPQALEVAQRAKEFILNLWEKL